MVIKFSHKGNFAKTHGYLTRLKNVDFKPILEKYARMGVQELSKATPIDTRITANSWDYEIKITRTGFTIVWLNKNVNDGVPIVILIQYGHATRSGSFVEGRDFINPAMKPIFEKIVEDLWKEVRAL